MGWSVQGYFNGKPQTTDLPLHDRVGLDEIEVETRNSDVPTGLDALSLFYGCSLSTFFRGHFAGSRAQAEGALQQVRRLAVYENKAGGIYRLEDHFPHFTFYEHTDGYTYFFDTGDVCGRPEGWKLELVHLLPPDLRHVLGNYPDPPEWVLRQFGLRSLPP
jgi:hypothetical protein